MAPGDRECPHAWFTGKWPLLATTFMSPKPHVEALSSLPNSLHLAQHPLVTSLVWNVCPRLVIRAIFVIHSSNDILTGELFLSFFLPPSLSSFLPLSLSLSLFFFGHAKKFPGQGSTRAPVVTPPNPLPLVYQGTPLPLSFTEEKAGISLRRVVFTGTL